MRPRVPANRRKTNPVGSVPRAQSEDCAAMQYGNVLTSISSGFTGMASRVLPLMPVDGPLAFEIIIFLFTSVSLFLQNLQKTLSDTYNNRGKNQEFLSSLHH